MKGLSGDPLRQLRDAIAIACSSRLRSGFDSESAMVRHIYYSVYSARRELKTIPASFLDHDFVKWVASRISDYRTTMSVPQINTPGGCFGEGRGTFACRRTADGSGGCSLLQKPAFSLTRAPGFLSVTKGDLARVAVGERVKIYFALLPSGAPLALSQLVGVVDAVAKDYGVKVLAHPRMYFRSDAGVLYARLSELDDIIDAVSSSILSKLQLRPVEPLASKRIWPGVAWAQDHVDAGTGRELSFGQWVSGVIASFCTQDGDNLSDHALEDVIASAGRDPLRPYRVAGTSK
jgi:hypothetical protein